MKLAPRSLRWRLQLWHGLLLLGVLSAFGFTAHHLERTQRLRATDEDLQVRLAALVGALRDRRGGPMPKPGETPSPNLDFPEEVRALFSPASGCYYAVWMRGRNPVSTSDNAPDGLQRPLAGEPVTRSRNGLREAFIFAAPADCVLVGRSMAGEEKSLMLHAAWLSGAGIVLLVLGLVGGSWLVGRAIHPITTISETAVRISKGDLAQRIPQTETDSELGRLTAVLNSTFAKLDSAFTQQARFTADAAHELRTPLTVMLSELQTTLARGRSADEYRASLEVCERSVQHMRRLTTSLLELARIDAGQANLRQEPCDLAGVVRDSVQFLTPMAQEAGVSFHLELASVLCLGSAEGLSQIATNLAANAVQHGRSGGTVTLTTRPEGKTAQLIVHNEGTGIAPEDLPHLFERFYRADKARSSKGGHVGLGLSIVEAWVTSMGGSVRADSRPGNGATFTVTLPLAG